MRFEYENLCNIEVLNQYLQRRFKDLEMGHYILLDDSYEKLSIPNDIVFLSIENKKIISYIPQSTFNRIITLRDKALAKFLKSRLKVYIGKIDTTLGPFGVYAVEYVRDIHNMKTIIEKTTLLEERLKQDITKDMYYHEENKTESIYEIQREIYFDTMANELKLDHKDIKTELIEKTLFNENFEIPNKQIKLLDLGMDTQVSLREKNNKKNKEETTKELRISYSSSLIMKLYFANNKEDLNQTIDFINDEIVCLQNQSETLEGKGD